MTDNITIIREFIAAWSHLDADELADYFTDDGVYHNMPSVPVSGRDNICALISNFIGNWTNTEWVIVTIMAQANVVIAERMDRTRLGEKSVDLRCCGVFEMRDGKIAAWRDYFDMATYTRALGG
jgi:limonene-1,2-epoxide hydrolase